MAVEITLKLPENLIEYAKKLGEVTQRDLTTVLSDALQMLWLTVDDFPDLDSYTCTANLSDDQVLILAKSKMDEQQNQRLGFLQSQGKIIGLTEGERYELMALLQIYQIGQLRKSSALAEVVKRGLSTPLPS